MTKWESCSHCRKLINKDGLHIVISFVDDLGNDAYMAFHNSCWKAAKSIVENEMEIRDYTVLTNSGVIL